MYGLLAEAVEAPVRQLLTVILMAAAEAEAIKFLLFTL
jgi:hypothetical protein